MEKVTTCTSRESQNTPTFAKIYWQHTCNVIVLIYKIKVVTILLTSSSSRTEGAFSHDFVAAMLIFPLKQLACRTGVLAEQGVKCDTRTLRSDTRYTLLYCISCSVPLICLFNRLPTEIVKLLSFGPKMSSFSIKNRSERLVTLTYGHKTLYWWAYQGGLPFEKIGDDGTLL